ncbi:MAG: hypothetical protein ChlgKO_06530 [Chlamydiales bacterium]
MATNLDSGWAEIPRVTSDSLTQKHERFLDLKVRVIADEKIHFSKEGVIARNFALNDGNLKKQVEQACSTDIAEVREAVDQLLDEAISVVSGVFDARVRPLNEDLRRVLNSQGGKNWGLDRNLTAYRLEGFRASAMKFFGTDRGTNEEVYQALNKKLTQIRDGSFSVDKFVQTDFEAKTINLINIAIKTRYAVHGAGA